MKNKIKIIAICGKSAAGKDTLLKEILKLDRTDLHEIVSCTTRPPREGEVDGINYHFLTNQEFADKIENGQMLEATVFRDWCYGTSLDSLKSDGINVGVFNLDGVDILLDNPKIDLYIVEVYAPDKLRLLRSLNREVNPDVKEIIRRYEADEKDFEGFNDAHYRVENLDDTRWMTLEDHAKLILIQSIRHWAGLTN